MTGKERLIKIIDYLGLNPNSFAESLGMKRAETIYKVTRDGRNISNKLAHLITTKYTFFNYEWVLREEGEMLKNESSSAISEPVTQYSTPSNDKEELLRRIIQLQDERDQLKTELAKTKEQLKELGGTDREKRKAVS